MIVSLIAALAQNRVIGVDNKIPWKLSEDLKHFKKLTLDHTVIMGRKTYDSIGKPLPGRRMIVVTKNRDFAPNGVEVAHTIKDALAAAGADEPSDKEVFVAGGAEIYSQLMPRADRMYLTLLWHFFQGDTYFPEIRWSEWRRTSLDSRSSLQDQVEPVRLPLLFDFLTYERNIG